MFFSVSTRTEISSSHQVGEDCLKIAAYKKQPCDSSGDSPAIGQDAGLTGLCNGVDGISLGEQRSSKPGRILTKCFYRRI